MSTKQSRLRVRRHAIARARDRYDVWLEPADLQMLTQVIRAGLGRTIYRKRGDGTLVVLVTTLCGTTMTAVYAPHRHRIITFLPMDCWERKSWEALKRREVRREALRSEALVD